MIINEISRGITHIEDLPIDDFYNVLRNISDYEITEKVDGSQLLFGLDESGFYTSRETKGGKRIYAVKDYDISFPTTYMRSVHTLLEYILPELRTAGLRIGDQIEAEALFGGLPNVVPYSDDTNYLIFLRTTDGTVDIDRLQEALSGLQKSVILESPFTEDGRNISFRDEVHKWKFSRVPKFPLMIENIKAALEPVIFPLTKYLRSPSGINLQPIRVIESTPLNKRPEWCDPEDWKTIKVLIKEQKVEIAEKVSTFLHSIKETLLNHLVRNTASSFGPLLEDGGWIEGVVLRHRTTGKMVKLVDKNVFGTIREAAWDKRNQLSEHAKSEDTAKSFLGNLLVELATAIGHPKLGTIQAKRYLKSNGILTEDILENLSTDINFSQVRKYWLNLFDLKEAQLAADLDKYAKEETEATIHMEANRPRAAIYERTIQTYAATFYKIHILREATLQAKRIDALFIALVGKQLGDLT